MIKPNNAPLRARAPLRLGFAGGGTDLSPFCDTHGGFIMNATVALYAYAHLTPRNDDQVLFEALEQNESFTHRATEQLPIDSTTLLHRGVYNRVVRDFNGGHPIPVTVRTTVDVPSGSGMGGSSALVVALLEAFRAHLALPLGEYDLARLAFSIEREDLKLSGGKQDQYAAAFGGFNFMEFHDQDRVIVNPLRLPTGVIRELEASLVLYYTGQSRSSAQIIETQREKVKIADQKSLSAMQQLKQEALDMKEALLTSDFDRIAATLRRGWEAKKATSSAISNTEIERILELALTQGAVAGKVSGAGGGGFLMILCPPERRQRVVDVLERQDGRLLPCKFTKEGALSWRSLGA
ncbi:dehydrogenase [Brevundimonas sp.]|uniref:GHMP family kinase ATP-binding protein n=1 Tax=Brevundimonas sp. TaxID=1871086 RepID=UPI0025BC619E|nr:dehydrogenase [Brevundimonas sp.]